MSKKIELTLHKPYAFMSEYAYSGIPVMDDDDLGVYSSREKLEERLKDMLADGEDLTKTTIYLVEEGRWVKPIQGNFSYEEIK